MGHLGGKSSNLLKTRDCLLNFYGVLKVLMPITFSSPRAQPEVVHFLISNESPYFSGCKSKILALNSLLFWRYDKKCEINW